MPFYRGYYIRKSEKGEFYAETSKMQKSLHFPNVLEFLPADDTEKKNTYCSDGR